MTNEIVAFLDERKQTKLKKPGGKSVEEIESDFQIANWVASAARRAGQLSMVSHPGKFSHPDAKITPVLYVGQRVPDGYVRSGNVAAPHDVLGNAAALDVYAFLSIVLSDERSVLDHLESNSAVLRGMLGVEQDVFDQWRQGLLEIKSSDIVQKTDGGVKQVYFPVGDDYHLLSVLTPSGLVTENRNRIRDMKFSEEAKAAREARKKGEASETGLDDLFGLLTVRYGGTQPQNISKLNSNNAGEAWLLPSLPPTLARDHVRIPKRDFFETLRWDDQLKFIYTALHRIFRSDYTNINIRKARQQWFESIFEWVFCRAVVLQQLDPGWSDHESVRLPIAQKLWLDSGRLDQREDHDDWQQEIAESFSKWTVVTYRKLRKNLGDAAVLGQTEETAFAEELKAYARQMPEDIL
ncbi:CRISPR-associated protein Csy1 [Rubripirellula obstinata]|uniref:CRISPR-associated protein Csy1 n=1 Tax=Rubripirellula obstinata TaxID=406547 RepID=A0A5B1CJS4_9BACT|nr:type I-F CRISPR-associated protein Csy1 [Rubripirellula obstinata]KAA1260532.1 CRISPR-associated protein Csy1 [Rubripirellula obstinata]